MKALLIIDMQIGSFSPYSARYNTMEVISKINQLAEAFHQQNDKIIYIKHNGSKENCLIPNTTEYNILPELVQNTTDITVVKEANDAFYQTELESILKQNSITQLYICGCATDYCVDATVKSALTKDYELFITSDAHTTADRPYVDAPTLINHYNWLWADMTPTKYRISVSNPRDSSIVIIKHLRVVILLSDR